MQPLQTHGGRSDQANSRSRRVRRARGDGGAALVEFAIIAPLIFALIVGMFTGGISLSRKNSMTNAVREGARFGATLNEDVTSPDDWATAVQKRVLSLAPNDLQLSQICVRLVQDGAVRPGSGRSVTPSGCSGRAPAPPSGVPGQCVVQVWAYRTSELQVVFWSEDLPLDASALNRYERAGTPATCGS